MRYAFGTPLLLPNGREDGISEQLLGRFVIYQVVIAHAFSSYSRNDKSCLEFEFEFCPC